MTDFASTESAVESTQIAIPESKELRTEALGAIERARALGVVSAETYRAAGELRQSYIKKIKQLGKIFDPSINQSNKLHKTIVDTKKQCADPLGEAAKIIKQKMIDYDQEQKAIAVKKQLELERQEKAQAEKDVLETAELMEQCGLKEEANNLLEKPIEFGPVSVKKQTPKVTGFSYRGIWKAECTDMKAMLDGWKAGLVPEQAFLPNNQFLRQQASSYKEAFKGKYPGVNCWEKKV